MVQSKIKVLKRFETMHRQFIDISENEIYSYVDGFFQNEKPEYSEYYDENSRLRQILKIASMTIKCFEIQF